MHLRRLETVDEAWIRTSLEIEKKMITFKRLTVQSNSFVSCHSWYNDQKCTAIEMFCESQFGCNVSNLKIHLGR